MLQTKGFVVYSKSQGELLKFLIRGIMNIQITFIADRLKLSQSIHKQLEAYGYNLGKT